MPTEDINARADIPPSVHPDMLSPLASALDKPGTAGWSAYNAGRVALGEMRKSYAAMQDAERALQAAAPPAMARQIPGGRTQLAGDIRMGPEGLRRHSGREEELAVAADRAFNRTARTVDLRLAEMKAHASILEEKVAEALKDPRATAADGIAVAQEVRAHLRSLPETERFDFIRKAIDGDDRRTVAAVLAAPPFLSGIGAETSAMVRDQAARRWASVEHEQARAVAKAIKRVMDASGIFVERYAKVLDIAKGPNAEASRAIGRLANG